jgi:hypothetical protein
VLRISKLGIILLLTFGNDDDAESVSEMFEYVQQCPGMQHTLGTGDNKQLPQHLTV